jgi:adenylate cyclase class 2
MTICLDTDTRSGSHQAIRGPFGYPELVPVETEVKIRISDIQPVQNKLRELGFQIRAPRVFESNIVFDAVDARLRNNGKLLRVRRAGDESLLTFKGPGKDGPHKSREEIETNVNDADATEQILTRLGFKPGFRYEKYRTEFSRSSGAGIVTMDETPIGNFLEIEGPPEWIDSTARELAYSPSEYITKSYAALYVEYCRERRVEPSNMVFERRTQVNT